MQKQYIFCIFFLLTESCTRLLCGELSGIEKERFDKGALVASALNYKLENIPCECYYINLQIKSTVIDTNIISKIHHIIYNDSDKIGWHVIRVYSKDGKFLFGHNYDDRLLSNVDS